MADKNFTQFNQQSNLIANEYVVGYGVSGYEIKIPIGYLVVSGEYKNISTITGDYVLQNTDSTILIDASSGNILITLPDVSAQKYKKYTFKKIDSSSNTATISGDANIDGSSTNIISGQYDSIRIHSNQTQWWLV